MRRKLGAGGAEAGCIDIYKKDAHRHYGDGAAAWEEKIWQRYSGKLVFTSRGGQGDLSAESDKRQEIAAAKPWRRILSDETEYHASSNEMQNLHGSPLQVFLPALLGANAVSRRDFLKYSVSAIIPKSDTETIDDKRSRLSEAKKNSVLSSGAARITRTNLKLPLRDGDIDRPEDEAYADSYFLPTPTANRHQVVDKNMQAIPP